MARKWMLLIVLPLVALTVVGCPKKKPEPVKEDIKMETRKVEPPAAPPRRFPPARPRLSRTSRR